MAVGNLAGAIPAGQLIQKCGLRRALFICIWSATAIFTARSIWLAFPLQLVFAFLCGVTLSLWAICISPAVAQLTSEKQRPFAFSLFFSLGIGVGALAGLAGGRLPNMLGSLNGMFHAFDPERAVLLLSCAIVALSILPATALRFEKTTAAPARVKALLSPFLLRYLPAIAVWSLVTGSFSPFANVYFSRHLQMSLPQVGTIFSLSQLVQVVAVLLAPLVFRRWGLVSGIVYMQCATALCLLTLSLFHSPLWAAVGYIGFTAFQWMNEPGTYSLLMNGVAADERGGAAASNSLAISATQAIAAICAGDVFTRYGYSLPLRGIAGIAGIAALLFWILLSPAQETSTLREDLHASEG